MSDVHEPHADGSTVDPLTSHPQELDKKSVALFQLFRAHYVDYAYNVPPSRTDQEQRQHARGLQGRALDRVATRVLSGEENIDEEDMHTLLEKLAQGIGIRQRPVVENSMPVHKKDKIIATDQRIVLQRRIDSTRGYIARLGTYAPPPDENMFAQKKVTVTLPNHCVITYAVDAVPADVDEEAYITWEMHAVYPDGRELHFFQTSDDDYNLIIEMPGRQPGDPDLQYYVEDIPTRDLRQLEYAFVNHHLKFLEEEMQQKQVTSDGQIESSQ